MSSYCYEAVDSGGLKTNGTLDVMDQSEALRRIKEMGLFPTKITQAPALGTRPTRLSRKPLSRFKTLNPAIPFFSGRIKPSALAVFTRQLATLVEAGMPLLRGLRTLQEQGENRTLERLLGEIALSIETGGSLSDALAEHPKIFNRLYVNMVKAGELGGALEITLRRLAEFIEKAQKIKNKVKAAMFYPMAVMVVAAGIVGVMMAFVIPRFQQVFDGLLNGAPLPPFTALVLHISSVLKDHIVVAGIILIAGVATANAVIRTAWGRWTLDGFKLRMPILGPVFRKLAISRFTRTLGTLLSSGVPILQALTIVKETSGNAVVGNVISKVHESVKEGETIAVPLKASRVFPSMVAGMVDIGEQTGALPDMLMKIADGYDEEVDNAVISMTSLLEPLMIVFLAIIVGSIVIAMFLPLLHVMDQGFGSHDGGEI